MQLACSADETKLWLSLSVILVLGPHLCTRIQVCAMIGLLKTIAIVDLPIKVKGNWKCSSGNSLSPLGAQNKNISAISQMLLTKVKLRLQQGACALWTRKEVLALLVFFSCD